MNYFIYFSTLSISLMLLTSVVIEADNDEHTYFNSSGDKFQTLFENDTLIISELTKICVKDNRQQQLKFLRFENKLSTPISFNVERYIYRKGECTNCNSYPKDEFTFNLSLEANQVLKGDCSSTDNKSLYVFDKFVKTVPGMSNTTVTDIQFKNFNYID